MHQRTSQVMHAFDGTGWREFCLPAAQAEVLPGVSWGAFDEILTPAFWAGQAWLHADSGRFAPYKLGRSLREEVAACILGGYGIPAEVGLAAFERLREQGLLEGSPSDVCLEDALAQPLLVNGRKLRYRFRRQKARHLSGALRHLREVAAGREGRALRNALMTLSGIGPKTASWITRNWCDADDVAILDVHVCRACERAGVFPAGSKPSRHYLALEERYLRFSRAIGVRASTLDNLIWQTMRRLPHWVTTGAR
jgi:thermostable 8-oxoguanine DNA glycosylase